MKTGNDKARLILCLAKAIEKAQLIDFQASASSLTFALERAGILSGHSVINISMAIGNASPLWPQIKGVLNYPTPLEQELWRFEEKNSSYIRSSFNASYKKDLEQRAQEERQDAHRKYRRLWDKYSNAIKEFHPLMQEAKGLATDLGYTEVVTLIDEAIKVQGKTLLEVMPMIKAQSSSTVPTTPKSPSCPI